MNLQTNINVRSLDRHHLLLDDSPFSLIGERQLFSVELGEPNGVAGKKGVPVDLGVCAADPGTPTPLKRDDMLSQSNTKSNARYANHSQRTNQQRGIDMSRMSGIMKGMMPRRTMPITELSTWFLLWKERCWRPYPRCSTGNCWYFAKCVSKRSFSFHCLSSHCESPSTSPKEYRLIRK